MSDKEGLKDLADRLQRQAVLIHDLRDQNSRLRDALRRVYVQIERALEVDCGA